MKKIILLSLVTLFLTPAASAQMEKEIQEQCKKRIKTEFQHVSKDIYHTHIFMDLIQARLSDGFISCHDELDAMIRYGLTDRNNSAKFFEILLDASISLQRHDWTWPNYVLKIKPEWAKQVFTRDDALVDKREEIELGDTFLHILLREQGNDASLHEVSKLAASLVHHAGAVTCVKNEKGKTPKDEFTQYKSKHMHKIAGKEYLDDSAKEIIDLLNQACKS